MQVNASGQFCGVAEMIGPVDFKRDMDFWQQDKWSGSLPVRWHIIKDVPNTSFRHILLENNENFPHLKKLRWECFRWYELMAILSPERQVLHELAEQRAVQLTTWAQPYFDGLNKIEFEPEWRTTKVEEKESEGRENQREV